MKNLDKVLKSPSLKKKKGKELQVIHPSQQPQALLADIRGLIEQTRQNISQAGKDGPE